VRHLEYRNLRHTPYIKTPGAALQFILFFTRLPEKDRFTGALQLVQIPASALVVRRSADTCIFKKLKNLLFLLEKGSDRRSGRNHLDTDIFIFFYGKKFTSRQEMKMSLLYNTQARTE